VMMFSMKSGQRKEAKNIYKRFNYWLLMPLLKIEFIKIKLIYISVKIESSTITFLNLLVMVMSSMLELEWVKKKVLCNLNMTMGIL
jgi:hypothetical protein